MMIFTKNKIYRTLNQFQLKKQAASAHKFSWTPPRLYCSMSANDWGGHYQDTRSHFVDVCGNGELMATLGEEDWSQVEYDDSWVGYYLKPQVFYYWI